MKYLVIAFLLTSCFSIKTPQLLAPAESLHIAIENPTHMDIDGMGNFYVVQSNRLLKKYDYSGKHLITYDEQSLGIISSISCNNALYTMIHFQDSKSLVFLDRNMAVLQTLSYENWTKDDITAAEISNDNQVWLYNNTKRRLQKYSVEGKLLLESFDLYGLSQKNLYVNQIVEHNNFVYLKNVDGEVIIMDNLGRYIKDSQDKFYSDLTASPSGVHAVLEEGITLNLFDEFKKKKMETISRPHQVSMFKVAVFGAFDNGIASLTETKY